MIRRDYILRMIEEFFRAFTRLQSLKKNQAWGEAAGDLDSAFQRLIRTNAAGALAMSESELLSRLVEGEATHLVRDKTLMLTTLLREAGDVAVAGERTTEGTAFYLKSLHLLLDTLARGEVFESPEFVPKVDFLLESLRGTVLPAETLVRLMQHFERNGEFARAEDALFALLEAGPSKEAVAEFGLQFYQRILGQRDAMLAAGGLPRVEAMEGMHEMQQLRG